MLIAIVCAIAAGGSFAGGGVLQQHVASTRPEDEQLSFRLLADLARQPLWLLGIGLAFLSYVLESLALAFGPLVMVQPLVVTELLFALPISVRWHGMRMGPREWAGALAVACGLGVGLASAAPRAGRPFPPILSWGLALAVVAVLATTAVAVGRRSAGPLRSSLFALAAGLVLATQAALLKATIALFRQGFVAALGSWQLWAMVLASFIGLLLVQSAYQAGPLAARGRGRSGPAVRGDRGPGHLPPGAAPPVGGAQRPGVPKGPEHAGETPEVEGPAGRALQPALGRKAPAS